MGVQEGIDRIKAGWAGMKGKICRVGGGGRDHVIWFYGVARGRLMALVAPVDDPVKASSRWVEAGELSDIRSAGSDADNLDGEFDRKMRDERS